MRDVGIEVWKDIPGYSRYQVSSFGRVKSLPVDDTIYHVYRNDGEHHTEVWHRKGKVLSPIKYGSSYQVRLYKNRVRKSVNISLLVLWVFDHPYIATYDEFKRQYKVTYIDHNPKNTAYSNLMAQPRRKLYYENTEN